MAVTFTANLDLGLQDAGEPDWSATERQTFQRIEDRLATPVAGNPNGVVAGFWVGQPIVDSTNRRIWICTTATGVAGTSVWQVLTLAGLEVAAITSGTITGITDLAVADGGTGAGTAANARSNLGTNDAANLTTGTIPNARLGTDVWDDANAPGKIGAFNRGAIGVPAWLENSSGATINGNATESGANLEYAAEGGTLSSGNPSGTWRNMGPDLANGDRGLFVRVS